MASFAIAKNTILELVRNRQAIPLGVLFIFLPTLMARFVFGSESLRTVSMVYWFFAAMLNLIFSAGMIGNDISGGQIQLLVTKPVRLSQILLGKIAGILLVMMPAIVGMNVSLFWVASRGEEVSLLLWSNLTCTMVLSQVLLTSVSAVLSVFLPQSSNAVAVVLGGIVFMGLEPLSKFYPPFSFLSVVLELFFPHPIALREIAIQIAYSEPVSWSLLLHSVTYTSGALLIALMGFNQREFHAH